MDDKRITELIKQLSAPDPEQRRLSAELLGRSHHYRALIPLQNALTDPDPQVRYRAAKGLVWRAGVAKGISLMSYPDPEVRQGAIWAVDELRKSEASPALLQALVRATTDPDGGSRAAAAYVLGHLGGAQAVEPLLKMLTDPHRLTRMNAIDALGKLADPRAVEPLLAQLADDEAPRYVIIEALGKLQDTRAIPYLRPLIRDQDSFVQEAAIQALITLEGAKTAIQLLLSEEISIRGIAALWLMQQSEDILCPHLPKLLALLEYPPEDLCAPLIRILAQAKDHRVLPQLVTFLRHPNTEIRLTTLHALQRLGNSQAMLPVLLATKDHDQNVRALAQQVLTVLAENKQKERPPIDAEPAT